MTNRLILIVCAIASCGFLLLVAGWRTLSPGPALAGLAISLVSIVVAVSGSFKAADNEKLVSGLAQYVRHAIWSEKWEDFPDASQIRDSALAEVVAGFRYLLGELADSRDRIRQFQSGALEQHRQLLDKLSEHERDAERLRKLAYFDGLTGLPNRWLFFDRLERVVANARRHCFDTAILAIDIDQLKRVNDSLGQRIGDKLLEIVAPRL